MLVADVNWLLSALAQSSAALIAIVGGLLVSRYVALHAEQEGARRRVEDLRRRQEEARADLDNSWLALDTFHARDALDDPRAFKQILVSDLQATVKEVLQAIDHSGSGLNMAIFERELAAMMVDAREAIDTLADLVPVADEHDDWTTFRREHDIEIGQRRLWEWVYDRRCEEQQEAARRAREQRMRNTPFGGLRIPLVSPISPKMLVTYSSPEILAADRMIGSQHQADRVRRLRDRIADADGSLRALGQELRIAEETYDATRQPEGFFLALQVLSVLAVVGMGVPVVFMGFAPMTLPGWVRVAIVASFFGGVGLLLRFLFVYASYLRDGGRETLPRHLPGLIWARR